MASCAHLINFSQNVWSAALDCRSRTSTKSGLWWRIMVESVKQISRKNAHI